MKAIISLVNVAAHSGKTTIAVNLAAELATRGLRTLLIDADPQAHTTSYFMKPEEVVRTLSDVLLPKTRSATPRKLAIWDIFSPANLPHLGVVGGDIGLATFEGLESSRASDFKAHLGAISEFHEIVIIDTSSSLALLTQACLCASTHIIVPVSPGGQGVEGLQIVDEYMDNMTCEVAPPHLSVVCNKFDCRDHSSGLLYERLKSRWGERVFDTIIHRDDQVEECVGRGTPVLASAPMSPAADLYACMADEVLTKLHLAPIRQATSAEG